MKIKSLQYFLPFFLIFLILLPTTVFAVEIAGYDPIKIIFGPDVPEEWQEPYKFMQYLVFPFIALWVVLFGILSEIRIFRRREGINAIIAFLIAMIAGPTGGLVWLVRNSLIVLGAWGFLVFAALLGVGITLWAASRLWAWGAPWTTKTMRGKAMEAFEIERKAGRLRDYYNELMAAGRYAEAKAVLDEIFKLEEQKKKIKEEKGGIPHA
jgi:hypothetical protein